MGGWPNSDIAGKKYFGVRPIVVLPTNAKFAWINRKMASKSIKLILRKIASIILIILKRIPFEVFFSVTKNDFL